ncbi:PEP-CTERM sorting domain-containing protein [Catenovulum sp. SM1970]|uniref:PEP-CTERM sorting domain-containing protein n=1 Tax=Marinifaba aquimaris TaxID=2741323 RepID=UPI001574223C|nr:PEP-CTERM sorting domain-containing protein [Marinifaba aquimaris]NTS78750.1 PEP-CTERM sorting domain-containing protein [Marinifaba aquimaris]
MLPKLVTTLAICSLSSLTHASIIYTDALVTFGGVTPNYDSSTLTSSLLTGVNSTQLANTGLGGINNSGVFVETFDVATQLGTALAASPFGPGTQAFNSSIGDNSGCAVNGTGSGITTSGSFSVREDDAPGLALIGYDDNCFGYTPEDGSSSGTVNIDFNPILVQAGALTGTEVAMDYIGFYWATIDTYNTFTFRNNGIDVLEITGGDLSNAITNLQLGSTSQYVNVFFNQGIFFDELEVVSTRRAAEFDNIVNRIVPVPEPTSIGLIGIVLISLLRIRK